ncbi:hypothetical protein [Ileibacterium valens]|uniref:hypothetical protein n=1 Tax=Ileibacterium valens TaxID=1862668 RepID=UPI00273019C3|nr:hypothetical protein [Ileibacterium valens]
MSNEELDLKIIELHEQGLNCVDIAEQIGIGRARTSKRLKANGLKPHNKKPYHPTKITEEDIRYAYKIYKSGKTLAETVEELNLNCTPSNLRGVFARRGFELHPRGNRHDLKKTIFQTLIANTRRIGLE